MADVVNYLNRNNTSPMYSKLKRSIEESKQGKALPAQWTAMIKAMSTKGVKTLEIEESKILDWLNTQDSTKPVSKAALASKLDSMMFTIKEVYLQAPRYASWRQAGGKYSEVLYIANSERDNVVDDLEKLEYDMQELVFSPERLFDEPELAISMERERELLIEMKGRAIDFNSHHFSAEVNGRHGRNLLAHCRVTERPEIGLYFMEEVQSDWAQKGRKNDWKSIPKGPLVTNTEAWAGMVLRRHMQLAASNPLIQNFSWITETMRNGGKQNSEYELGKVEQKRQYDEALKAEIERQNAQLDQQDLMEDLRTILKFDVKDKAVLELRARGTYAPDMLNDFYLKVVPKIIDKILAGTGEKVQLKTISISPENTVTVPTIAITDKVRERLSEKQPVYSRALLLKVPRQEDDPVLRDIVRNAAEMLGSTKHLRLVTRLYDISTGNQVAGRYINKLTQISLGAQDISEACDHECCHYAQENLFTRRENDILLRAFAPGTALNEQVRAILTKRGDFALAQDCMHADESVAQGFALWRKGEIDVQDAPVRGIFSDLVQAVKDVGAWLRKAVQQENYQTTEEIFQAFKTGDIARRQEEFDRRYEKLRSPA